MAKKAHANRRILAPEEGRPALELARYPLFSRKEVATSASQTIQLFKNLGSADPSDTNMPNDGFLAHPMVYDVFGLALFVEQGISEADLVKFYNNTILKFYVSSKDYIHVPIHMVPSGGGLTGFAATGDTATPTTIFHATNCIPSPDVYLPIDIEGIPLHLLPQQNFFMEVKTFASSDFSATFKITGKVLGVLGRPVL